MSDPAGEYIERSGLIFRAGSYPEQEFAITPAELAAYAASFAGPVPLDLSHAETVLDGRLGELVAVEARGGELRGTIRLPRWLDRVLAGTVLRVSAAWDRTSKRILRLALVPDPQVTGAALFAAAPAPTPGATQIGGGGADAGHAQIGGGGANAGHAQIGGGDSNMADEKKDERETWEIEQDEANEAPAEPEDAATLRELLTEVRAQLAEVSKQRDKANTDARNQRKRLDDLERQERDKQDAKLPEIQKIERRAAEVAARLAESETETRRLREEIRSLKVAGIVEREARKADFEYPEDATRLIDPGLLEFDEDGEVKAPSIRTAVKKLAEDRPKLVRPRAGPGTTAREQQRGGGGRPAPQGAEASLEQLRATGNYAAF